MKTEVAFYLIKKLKVPNSIKVGLVLSYIVFEAFDIKGHVERTMQSHMSV